MLAQGLAAGFLLLLVAIAYMYYYGERLRKGGGEGPQVKAETFLYFDHATPAPSGAQIARVVAELGGRLATPGEVARYATVGGTAAGYGTTTTGAIYAAPGPLYTGPNSAVVHTPEDVRMPHGVWVTGPRPAVDAANIAPFNCKRWYQPAPQGS